MKFADTIIKGATFFLGKGLDQNYDFIAITDGKILALGMGDGWKEYQDKSTEIIEFTKEQLVIPGFHDSHLHLLMSALGYNYVDLSEAKSELEAVQMVKAFADSRPDDEWVVGLNWYHLNWEEKNLPTAASLDQHINDRPVLLLNSEVHGAWVNSKAMLRAGITRDTIDPPFGEIVRLENGEPSGFLNETAMGLAGDIALKFPLEREMELIKSAISNYVAFGVTSVQDLRPELGYDIGQYESYFRLEQNGDLDIRIHCAGNLKDSIDEVLAAQKKYNGDKFRICLLKQYLDGVPTTHTAMVTEPYLDNPTTMGMALNDIDEMQENVYAAHRAGISVKIHCCGEAAVNKALDFYQNAIEKYGVTTSRHAVEHAEIISAEDVLRFKKYNIIASMQPEHMTGLVDEYAEHPYLAQYSKKKLESGWIFRTLLDERIHLSFGTDCPVVSINPLINIYRAVTRKSNDGNPPEGMNPSQKITVEEALDCYTTQSAYGVHREDEIGTLEPGKYADMAVLNTNILTCDVEDIKIAKVVLTMMNGKVTFLEK